MKRLRQYLARSLSVRLSLMVALTTAALLMVALLIMLHYAQEIVREQSVQKAEQTLKGTVQNIDNILLSVEQASGNVYWEILLHLNNPDGMFTYCRKLLEASPYISGCAIAMEPYYYKSRGKYFMAYVYRSRKNTAGESPADNQEEELGMHGLPIIQAATFGNKPYNEQIWYTKTMEIGRPYWADPLDDIQPDGEAIVTYCLPIWQDGKRIGVLGVDVPLSLLSAIVLDTKPSPNAYSTMLSRKGSFIVHPNGSYTHRRLNVFKLAEKQHDSNIEMQKLASAMMEGKRGHTQFIKNDTIWYAFYEPFERTLVPGRSNDKMGWSVAVMYSENDIMGDYNLLKRTVIGISVLGILLLLIACTAFAHRFLLPLRMLTQSAQHIAEGHYDEPIPVTHHRDEIGQLQQHFQLMQQALANHMNELERLHASLQQQGTELEAAYQHAQEADRIKTTVLHNMTNRMTEPAEAILSRVQTLRQQWSQMNREEAEHMVADIQAQTQTITNLLDDLLRKEQ